MTKYKIKNIQEYLDVIEEIKTQSEAQGNNSDLLFRGQSVDLPLIPKLGRLRLNGKILNIETLILKEFERGLLPLSEFQPRNNWDLLALAQHHGLPTRLLDWTYSALIALWFAVHKPSKADKNQELINGVIWVLSADVEDFRNDIDNIDPLSNRITKVFRSTVISRRISAQSGLFTVHKINNNGKFIQLENHGTYKNKLSKLIVPAQQFSSIRKQLNMMGVNNASVFPDIDGFCKHLEWRFSKMSDEKS